MNILPWFVFVCVFACTNVCICTRGYHICLFLWMIHLLDDSKYSVFSGSIFGCSSCVHPIRQCPAVPLSYCFCAYIFIFSQCVSRHMIVNVLENVWQWKSVSLPTWFLDSPSNSLSWPTLWKRTEMTISIIYFQCVRPHVHKHTSTCMHHPPARQSRLTRPIREQAGRQLVAAKAVHHGSHVDSQLGRIVLLLTGSQCKTQATNMPQPYVSCRMGVRGCVLRVTLYNVRCPA